MEGRAPPVSPLSRPLNCRPLFPAPFRRPLTEHKRRVSFQDFLKFQTEPFSLQGYTKNPKKAVSAAKSLTTCFALVEIGNDILCRTKIESCQNVFCVLSRQQVKTRLLRKFSEEQGSSSGHVFSFFLFLLG